MLQNYEVNRLYRLGIVAAGLLLLVLSPGLLPNLLSTNGFIPHGHCYLWKPQLVWLHVTSDLLIGTAYIAISATLAYLVVQTRREIPFHWMFLAFGLFITACSSTHFLEVVTLWQPVYWLSGDVKVLTAIASVTTALALPPLVPQALKLLQTAKASEERRQQLETANQELEALYHKVKQLDQAKTQFFANVSHELRTPLALILGPLEKLLVEEALTSEQRYSLELVERNARGLLNQVNYLLDIARLEMQQMPVHYSQMDLAQATRLTAAFFETLAEERQIEFSVETPPHLPGQLDAEKFRQILLNLLSNAFKFTPLSGMIRLTLQTVSSDSAASGATEQAVLTIQDSGPGVPEALREAIFDRFYTRAGGDTTRFGSTGLGLAIVEELVVLQGGTVVVGDGATGGACFTITLPLVPPAGTEVAVSATDTSMVSGDAVVAELRGQLQESLPLNPSTLVKAEADRPLVLVVEDNPDMNWFISTTLASTYRVARASDGQEGLEQAIALQPDLILSDVMMPRLSGDQLVAKLRARPELAQIPIILLTARNDTDLRVALLQQGVQDYLTKPFSAAELEARVNNLISLKQVRQTLQAELASQSQDVAALASELSLRQQELQKTLEALQVSEARFRRATLNAPFPVMIHAEDGTILTLSETWTELTGYTQADIPTIADWLERAYGGGQEAIRADIDRLYSLQQRVDEGEYVVTTSTGEQRIWDFSSAPLGTLPDGRRLVISMARDATERHFLERTLRQQTEELASMNRMKDEFLATLSHELRTPLNSILGWTKLLQTRQMDALTTSRALETIERNARLQSQLIEDLLEISRIIQGKLRLNVQPMSMVSVVEAALNAVRPAAEAKSIQLELTSPQAAAGPWEPVLGDSDRLQQVVWNLLSNAIKFTPEGGQVEVEVSQGAGRDLAVDLQAASRDDWQMVSSNYVRIQVRDTGIGIKPEFLPYVFDRFRQADSSLTRSHSGLGLGLAIVRHLVELHGGRVWVTSAGENRGATFVVVLPLLRGTAGVENSLTPTRAAETSQACLSPLYGLRALVVDDDADTRTYLEMTLEAVGIQVVVADSGKTALTYLVQSASDHPFDILISDIGMPEQDGYALVRQIRTLEPLQGGQIPAIALTAYASEEDHNRAILAGFQLHLKKPVEPRELIQAIATLMGRTAESPVPS